MTDGLFHAFDPRDGIVCHNIKLSAGRLTAISFVRAAVPEWSGMRSPYEAFIREAEKEDIFEAVRAKEFATAPPRKGSLFLFSSREDADRANANWWQEQRVVLLARVIQASRVGAFDAKQLDGIKGRIRALNPLFWSQ